ncbi:hypothetical protein DT23_16475 [Thioclava indica]|uniref:Uncharacterized protein n=1 Tax=Thioclava indica TaxID=1353528 RepID=A0A074K9W6_9RHOB|nr:hypothetical protein DT23_16475 [Thioclava indica]
MAHRSQIFPSVFAGENDGCPSKGRDLSQKLWRAVKSGALLCRNCLSEIFCSPVDDDGCQQVEAGHAIVLPLGGSVADFALRPDAQGVFQGRATASSCWRG